MVCMMYDWIKRILHVCANVASVGITVGVSTGSTSLSHGIKNGSWVLSVYKVEEIYMSARLTGTSKVALIPRSSL